MQGKQQKISMFLNFNAFFTRNTGLVYSKPQKSQDQKTFESI